MDEEKNTPHTQHTRTQNWSNLFSKRRGLEKTHKKSLSRGLSRLGILDSADFQLPALSRIFSLFRLDLLGGFSFRFLGGLLLFRSSLFLGFRFFGLGSAAGASSSFEHSSSAGFSSAASSEAASSFGASDDSSFFSQLSFNQASISSCVFPAWTLESYVSVWIDMRESEREPGAKQTIRNVNVCVCVCVFVNE